jgi:hypothetical protein
MFIYRKYAADRVTEVLYVNKKLFPNWGVEAYILAVSVDTPAVEGPARWFMECDRI